MARFEKEYLQPRIAVDGTTHEMRFNPCYFSFNALRQITRGLLFNTNEERVDLLIAAQGKIVPIHSELLQNVKRNFVGEDRKTFLTLIATSMKQAEYVSIRRSPVNP